MDDSLVSGLQEKYPGAFEGWDKFEVSITVQNRNGQNPTMLVVLYNEGTGIGHVVVTHNAFLLTVNDDGEESVSVGRAVVDEFHGSYVSKATD
jgi:hypothetical protein